MNDFVPFGKLPALSTLFRQRLHYYRERIYNLKVSDVATDQRFAQTLDFIKNAIIPKPIVFGDAIFHRNLPTDQASAAKRIGNRLRAMTVNHVGLPYTGCAELFLCAPQTLNLPPDAAILKPRNGCLFVKLNTIFFSRSEALYAAKELLRPTLQLIANNNDELSVWRTIMERRIQLRLEAFRRECDHLYNANSLLTLVNDV